MADDKKNPDSPNCYRYPYANGYYGGQLEFPGTQGEYNGNLRWLLCYYKQLVPQIAELEKQVSEIQKWYETLPQYIAQLVGQAVAPIFEQMGLIRQEIAEFKEDITQQQDDFLKQIQTIRLEVHQLEDYVGTVLPAAKMYSDMQDEKLKQWIVQYIQDIAREWPPVIDPSDGLTEDINTALRHMYNDLSNGVTYGELNSYMFTYGQLNEMHVTYGQLNVKAFQIFDRQLDQRFYMFSPVDGRYLVWRDVIWQLYRLHYPGVTYGQLNNKGLTYGELDNLALTYGEFNEPEWITNP